MSIEDASRCVEGSIELYIELYIEDVEARAQTRVRIPVAEWFGKPDLTLMFFVHI